ncbi:PH domain-containing protein [Actinotalea sp. BY-33]|uniref:PH domain-containing protein n=1 Tax=Actinotalea soli TaxID=2819234 RepID=A0A939RSM9_9CELL|nr:PH domain-containing protein [Actinotalea soli]
MWDDDRVESQTVEFRARSGRILTVAVGVLCGVAFVATTIEDPVVGLRYLPALLVPAVLVWTILGRPAVLVDDSGVELRNVLRTVHLPWPAILRIDTKYALTLETAYGTYSAWAAPAPGRMQALGAGPEDLAHLPESTYGAGGVRPGDLITSPSGQAAAHVRRRWEELRDAGHLDDPRLEAARPGVRWHVVPALAVGLLSALALVAVRL